MGDGSVTVKGCVCALALLCQYFQKVFEVHALLSSGFALT